VRDKVIALEDEANAMVAVYVPVAVRIGLRASTVYYEVARGVMVKTADYIEQCGFSASGRSEYGNKFVLAERDVNAAQGMHRFGRG
jgi:hypothetical protein